MAPERSSSVPSTSSQSASKPDVVYGDEVMFSGLNGKPLESGKRWPTKQEVFDVIPPHCLKRDTTKSMAYAASSLLLTAACGYAGTFIPMSWAHTPAWAAYAAVTGVLLILSKLALLSCCLAVFSRSGGIGVSVSPDCAAEHEQAPFITEAPATVMRSSTSEPWASVIL